MVQLADVNGELLVSALVSYRDPAVAVRCGLPAVIDRQGTDLVGVVGDLRHVLGDLAQRPGAWLRAIPGLRPGGLVAQHVPAAEPAQPGAGLGVVRLGEAGPVRVERHRPPEPLIGHRGGSGQQRLHLMQVIHQVIGDPAERLVRCPRVRQAVVHRPRYRPAVPRVPGPGQFQAPVHGRRDQLSRVRVAGPSSGLRRQSCSDSGRLMLRPAPKHPAPGVLLPASHRPLVGWR